MFLLYNGEFQDIDLPKDYNTQQILNALERRKLFIGRQIGDFEIITVEYDWGLRKQINKARCVLCGEEKEIPNLHDFDRGKGVRRSCPCRHTKKERRPTVGEACKTKIGQIVGGFKLVTYRSGRGVRIECVTCGKQKWVTGKLALAGEATCDHKRVRDYTDPSYIGKRVGNLTVVEREGRMFRFRCDCGAETTYRPTDIFRIDGVKSCGGDECPYHQKALKEGAINRKKGVVFEKECAAEMARQGYFVEMTPESGDYGVDFFATIDGNRVAFQCKRLKVASVVGAVQEVYAGGRYYDCSKFVVISPSGFSYSAELMASKLGVQLETDLQGFKLKSLVENKIDTQRMQTYSRNALLWEIDGEVKPASQWCAEYGVSKNVVSYRMQKGMDLKSALTATKYKRTQSLIELGGICKTKQEWCDDYGISPQLYDYRVKYSKLSPLEALSKEKQNLKSQSGKDRAVGETSTWIQLCWDLCG